MEIEVSTFREARNHLLKNMVYYEMNGKKLFDWWIIQKNPTCKGNSRKTATYYSMVGGLIDVDENEMDDFLALYDFVTTGLQWDSSLVEVIHKDALFLYIDVDLNTKTPEECQSDSVKMREWSRIAQKLVTKAVWNVTRDVLPNASPQRALVLCATPRPSPKGSDMTKIGIHIHFPTLAVTVQAARLVVAAVRDEFISSLKGETLAGIPCEDIGESIDTEPYKLGGGLRLMGANKLTKCLLCGRRKTMRNQRLEALAGGKKSIAGYLRARSPNQVQADRKQELLEKIECKECNGLGYVKIPGSAYYPLFLLDENGEVNEDINLMKDSYSCLKCCRLSVPETCEVHEAPIHLIEREEIQREMRRIGTRQALSGDSSKKRRRIEKAEDTSVGVPESSKRDIKMKDKMMCTDISLTGSLHQALNKVLTNQFNINDDSGITRLTACGNEYTGFIMVSTRSHFCVYKNGDHHSNHVWFRVNSDGITQRCYNVKCQDIWFKSGKSIKPVPLTDELKELVQAELRKLELLIESKKS